MNVTACLVTRGNVPMRQMIANLAEAGVDEIDVWDNSFEENAGVYGRYMSIARASHPVVFVQDDDCVLPTESIETLLAAYEPGRIVANMPEQHRKRYTDSCLIGFGAVFDRDLPAKAFARFERATRPYDYRKRADVIFTALTPFTLLDVPFDILPYAYGPDRMFKQPGHIVQRHLALKQARIARRTR